MIWTELDKRNRRAVAYLHESELRHAQRAGLWIALLGVVIATGLAAVALF